MQRLADALTPVTVDLGGSQPRLSAYLDSLRGRGRNAVLRLAPIAARSMPRPDALQEPVIVQGEDGSGAWQLVAPRIEAETDDSALIPLAQAHLMRRAMPAASSHDAHIPLVLVVPGGVPDVESFVFPIAGVDPDGCVLDATSALPPGCELPLVEVIGERRVLRRAAARVATLEPWRMPDGSPRFRCYLEFRRAPVSTEQDVYRLLSKPAAVRHVLRIAAMRMAWGSVEVPGAQESRGPVRFLRAASDHAILGCRPPLLRAPLPPLLRIGVEVFFVHYEMEVRPLERVPEGLMVALPLVMRQRQHARRAPRVTVGADAPVDLVFRNPVTGVNARRSVVDVSILGVSFYVQKEDALWQGLPLEDASLHWRERMIVLDDLEVVSVDERGERKLCRARTSKPKLAENPDLIDLIAALGHPEVQVHQGDDFTRMKDLYVKAGLFAPHMDRNLRPLIHRVEQVWQRMHRKVPSIVRTLVHGDPEAPNGAMTVVRAWEHAWVAQHFVSVDTHLTGTAGKLQLAMLDYVMPRPDGHFGFFFVKSDNHQMNAFYERFFASTGTPEAVGRCTVRFWSRASNGQAAVPEGDSQAVVRPLRAREVELVSRAAARVFGALVAAAMSFGRDELSIPDTAKRFRRAGITRSRRCRIVTWRRRPVYALVEEQTSPGFNLTWMLNAHWIVPLHPELDTHGNILRKALESVLKTPTPSPGGDHFVVTPRGCGAEELQQAGFRHEADVNVYALNRAGLSRYFQYTAHRYGELDAHAAARRARRERNQQRAS